MGSPQLSDRARALIADPDNERLLSIASLWEIAIKQSIGKMRLQTPFDEMFPAQLIDNDIEILPIEISHLSNVATLPMHHRDPFDRLIIAQGIVENVSIVSADAIFDAYPVTRLW